MNHQISSHTLSAPLHIYILQAATHGAASFRQAKQEILRENADARARIETMEDVLRRCPRIVSGTQQATNGTTACSKTSPRKPSLFKESPDFSTTVWSEAMVSKLREVDTGLEFLGHTEPNARLQCPRKPENCIPITVYANGVMVQRGPFRRVKQPATQVGHMSCPRRYPSLRHYVHSDKCYYCRMLAN